MGAFDEAMKELWADERVAVHGEPRKVYPDLWGINLSVTPEAVAFDTYQRPVEDWPLKPNPVGALGSILLSYRDGVLWGVDGQRRVKGLRHTPARYRKVTHLEALCYFGLTKQAEAHMFEVFNGLRKNLQRSHRLNARLCAQDDAALKMVEAVESLGLSVALTTYDNRDKSVDRIDCVKELEDGWRKYRSTVFSWGLETIREVWPHDNGKWHNAVVRAMWDFLAYYQHHPLFDHSTLLSQLRRHRHSDAFHTLARPKCKTRYIKTEAGVEAIVALYNEERATATPLPLPSETGRHDAPPTTPGLQFKSGNRA